MNTSALTHFLGDPGGTFPSTNCTLPVSRDARSGGATLLHLSLADDTQTELLAGLGDGVDRSVETFSSVNRATARARRCRVVAGNGRSMKNILVVTGVTTSDFCRA